MNMKRKFLLLSAGILIFSFALTTGIKAQTGSPIVEDKVIKVNRREPPKPSKYYSGTNIRKDKKFKVKMTMMKSWDCPSYIHYDSKPKRKREKKILKRRSKLYKSR